MGTVVEQALQEINPVYVVLGVIVLSVVVGTFFERFRVFLFVLGILGCVFSISWSELTVKNGLTLGLSLQLLGPAVVVAYQGWEKGIGILGRERV